MGVITYFLLAGYTPFDRDSQQLEMEAIIAGDYNFEPEEYWGNVSNSAKDFVRQCLTIDPASRPTAAEALQHKVYCMFLPQAFSFTQYSFSGLRILPRTSCPTPRTPTVAPLIYCRLSRRPSMRKNFVRCFQCEECFSWLIIVAIVRAESDC